MWDTKHNAKYLKQNPLQKIIGWGYGGIWILVVSMRNTKKYKLSYKAPGKNNRTN